MLAPLVLFCAGPPLAATEEHPAGFCQSLSRERDTLPPDLSGLPADAVIGKIELLVLDVFDLEESGQNVLPFRLANRLHINTRPTVVEQKLLFETGEPFDERVLQETERYLRSQPYLYDACVEPTRVRGDKVDVRVVTRDVWTLGARASFSRSGGANTVQFGLEDSNFLGTGRFLTAKYQDDPDRTERRLRFIDPALFGSRAELRLRYSERSDGHRHTLDLERPFFSLDTRWSSGTRLVSHEGLVRIYSQGDVVNRFVEDSSYVEVRGGISRGFREGGSRRWLFGFTFDERSFHPDLALDTPGTAPPSPLTLAYPWIGFNWIQDSFIERNNVDRMVRTEDFNLGQELHLRLGYSSPSWGADTNQTVIDAGWSRGLLGAGEHTLLFSAYGGGRFGGGGEENVILGGRLRHFFFTFGRHQLFTTVQVDAARNLDPERQLLLGGDSGLRGYPRRYRDGDRRALLSLEQRFYTNLELFKLVHVGAAVFFDAGRIWYEDAPVPSIDSGTLRNVGIGLRLGSSRSAQGSMIHFDVAYPLDGDEREIQWLINSKETF